ncbi:MAG: carboxy-S-adenosyl-L-methionine synthase CmoA [Pseudomonadota bacterium]|jgi:tRNA (cmo5U34)-methyltransferase
MLYKDNLYAQPISSLNAFQFDQSVADVFPDMIQRSVPGYATIIAAIGLLANHCMKDNQLAYDLGCSWGAISLSMYQHIRAKNCKIIAVDNSAAMINHCEQKLLNAGIDSEIIELYCADICEFTFQPAQLIVLNFTLQFVPLIKRQSLLQRIYQALMPGGILVLSEKIAFTDSQQQQLHTEMHHLFKQAQGYSDLEIAQKSAALNSVLIPETLAQHQQRLQQIGFNSAEVWFQYFNFASLLALK